MNRISKRLKYGGWSLVLLVILSGSCGKRPDEVIYRQVQEIAPPDDTCMWLTDTENFHDTTYYAVFENYYAEQLKQKKYASAAAALEAVAEKEMYFLHFTEHVRTEISTFIALYKTNLPWDKTIFTSSYLGNYYLDRGERRKAIACFENITRHKPFDYHTCTEVGHAYGDMAFCYSAIGEQEKALECNMKALGWFNKTDNLTGLGGIYDNLALVHMFTKNYGEADVYFDKAMTAYRQAGDTTNMFTTLHNKLLMYEETGSPRRFGLIDSTYRFFMRSGIQDESMEIALSSFYVDKLIHENRIAEIEPVLNAMEAHAEGLNSTSAFADYYITRAKYEIHTGEGIMDAEIIEKALEAVRENEDFQNEIAFSSVLKENAALHGDYKKALAFSEKEKEAMTALANREMSLKTMQLSKKHETEKKEQHIALQQKTILNRNIAIALLGALLATFCLAALVISIRQKQKKAWIESQRAVRYTRQLLEKTEEERKRIAGDLHDSVSHELLSLKNAIHGTDPAAGAKIDGIINDIRIISRNLHPIMFEKVGLAASVEQLVERTQSVYDLMVTAEVEYDGSLGTSDELQVYRILQEALSNTIKYAEAFAAKIEVVSRQDGLHIRFMDNGKGFNLQEKLSASNAFGLHNILERSRAIGGETKIHSDRNGTVITIGIRKRK